MKLSDLPTKFNIPWGDAAGAGFIRPIPQASQIGILAGAASLTDGFPPVTFDQVGAGGTPAWGADFNGILNEITLWNRWQGAGGLSAFDAVFAAAISGYPAGALVLSSAVAGAVWISVIDDNANDPDAVGTGWVSLGSVGGARVITTSGVFAMTVTDHSIGLNRTTSLATSSTTLPAAKVGQEFNIEDLVGNFATYPVTVSPPAGTIAGAPSAVLNVDGQSSVFRYYGSNLWSWRP